MSRHAISRTESHELMLFADALRDVLRLEPLYNYGRERDRDRTDAVRFYRVYEERLDTGRTPVRGSQ